MSVGALGALPQHGAGHLPFRIDNSDSHGFCKITEASWRISRGPNMHPEKAARHENVRYDFAITDRRIQGARDEVRDLISR